MDLQLSGKTALVTGASAGIGTGIALAWRRKACVSSSPDATRRR